MTPLAGDLTNEERNAVLEEAALLSQQFAWVWDAMDSREGTKACNSLAHHIRNLKRFDE